MRTLYKPLLAITALAWPLLAGALRLEVSDATNNPEAKQKHAVLVASTTACHEPEKTIMTATAEGAVNGVRQSFPLKIIPLSTAGAFAVMREWPDQGSWAVKVVATNPEYKNYATAVVVPVTRDSANPSAASHYYHAPTEGELANVLANGAARASLN